MAEAGVSGLYVGQGNNWVDLLNKEKPEVPRGLQHWEWMSKLAIAREGGLKTQEGKFINSFEVTPDGSGYNVVFVSRNGEKIKLERVDFPPVLSGEGADREYEDLVIMHERILSDYRNSNKGPFLMYHNHGGQMAYDVLEMARVCLPELEGSERERNLFIFALVHDDGEWEGPKKEETARELGWEGQDLEKGRIVWEATNYAQTWLTSDPESPAWKAAMRNLDEGRGSDDDWLALISMAGDLSQALSIRLLDPDKLVNAQINLAMDFVSRFGSLNKNSRITWNEGMIVDQKFGLLATKAVVAVWPIIERMESGKRARAWKSFMLLQQDLMPGVEFDGIDSMSGFLQFMQDNAGMFGADGDKRRLLGDPNDPNVVRWQWDGEDWSKERIAAYYRECLDNYKVVERRLKERIS